MASLPTEASHGRGEDFPAPHRATEGCAGPGGGQPEHGQSTNVGLGGPASGIPAGSPHLWGHRCECPIPDFRVRAQKMTADDDPEAFLSIFKRIAHAAGWPALQWSVS